VSPELTLTSLMAFIGFFVISFFLAFNLNVFPFYLHIIKPVKKLMGVEVN
jgi:hypothetical protein